MGQALHQQAHSGVFILPTGRGSVRTSLSRCESNRYLDQPERCHRCRSLDARVKSVITGCIHSLAAAFLVVALLAGAFLLVVFVSVRIGQESRSALIAATDAARNWSPASDDSNSLYIPQVAFLA